MKKKNAHHSSTSLMSAPASSALWIPGALPNTVAIARSLRLVKHEHWIQRSKQMWDRMSERVANRIAHRMPEECQLDYHLRYQVQSQIKCHTECQNVCPGIECHNICHLLWIIRLPRPGGQAHHDRLLRSNLDRISCQFQRFGRRYVTWICLNMGYHQIWCFGYQFLHEPWWFGISHFQTDHHRPVLPIFVSAQRTCFPRCFVLQGPSDKRTLLGSHMSWERSQY